MGEPNRHCPVRFLQDVERQTTGVEEDRTLIILNQPIVSFAILQHTWKNTSYRICADGGANRLHDAVEQVDRSLKTQYVGYVDSIG